MELKSNLEKGGNEINPNAILGMGKFNQSGVIRNCTPLLDTNKVLAMDGHNHEIFFFLFHRRMLRNFVFVEGSQDERPGWGAVVIHSMVLV